eukprot:g406.t1
MRGGGRPKKKPQPPPGKPPPPAGKPPPATKSKAIDYQQLVRQYGSHVKARQQLARLLEAQSSAELNKAKAAAVNMGQKRQLEQVMTHGTPTINSKLNRTRSRKQAKPASSLAQSVATAVRASYGSSRLELAHKGLVQWPPLLLSSFSLQMGVQLKVVKLAGNKLKHIPSAAFRFSPLIEELDLTGNQLRSLPKTVALLTRLTDLKLQGNFLESVPLSVGKLTSLRTAILSNNQISQLPHGFGVGMDHLRELKLDGNELTQLPMALAQMTKLEVLTLHRNHMVSMAMLQPPLPDEVDNGLEPVMTGNGEGEKENEQLNGGAVRKGRGQPDQQAQSIEGEVDEEEGDKEIWDEMYDPLMQGREHQQRESRRQKRLRGQWELRVEWQQKKKGEEENEKDDKTTDGQGDGDGPGVALNGQTIQFSVIKNGHTVKFNLPAPTGSQARPTAAGTTAPSGAGLETPERSRHRPGSVGSVGSASIGGRSMDSSGSTGSGRAKTAPSRADEGGTSMAALEAAQAVEAEAESRRKLEAAKAEAEKAARTAKEEDEDAEEDEEEEDDDDDERGPGIGTGAGGQGHGRRLVRYMNCGTGELVKRMPTCLDQWACLASLKSLRLSHQQLTTLPAGVGKCSSLTLLDCSSNGLRSLPSSIGQLSALTTLNCSTNSLRRLPRSIGGLTALSTLVVTDNRIATLPPELGSLTALETLRLEANALVDLPAELGALSLLTELRLEGNPSLPDHLRPEKEHEDALKRREWMQEGGAKKKQAGRGGKGGGVGGVDWCQQLLWGLRQAWLLAERGEPPVVQVIGSGVANEVKEVAPKREMQLARLIDAADTSHELNLLWQGLLEVPPAVFDLHSLQILRLNGNQLLEIPPAVRSLVQLHTLHATGNLLVDLPAEIGSLRKLRELVLDNNQLEELPDEICKLGLLRKLSVNTNRLQALPAHIGGSSHYWRRPYAGSGAADADEAGLEAEAAVELEADDGDDAVYPRATAPGTASPGTAPPSATAQATRSQTRTRGCHRLEHLSCAANILGSLPPSLCALRDLRVCNASSNCLESLPEHIGDMLSLEVLTLSTNELRALPSSLCTMRGLQELYLTSNQIGELPDAIGGEGEAAATAGGGGQGSTAPAASAAGGSAPVPGLCSVRVLWLDKNTLVELPPSFHRLHALQSLKLDYNPSMRSPPPPLVAGLTMGGQELVRLEAALTAERQQQQQQQQQGRDSISAFSDEGADGVDGSSALDLVSGSSRIEVWWEGGSDGNGEGEWYTGTVETVRWLEPSAVRGFCQRCRVQVVYDDGDEEELALEDEKWKMAPLQLNEEADADTHGRTGVGAGAGAGAGVGAATRQMMPTKKVATATKKSGRALIVEVAADAEGRAQPQGDEQQRLDEEQAAEARAQAKAEAKARRRRQRRRKQKEKEQQKEKLSAEQRKKEEQKDAKRTKAKAKARARAKALAGDDTGGAAERDSGGDGNSSISKGSGSGSRECKAGLAALMQYLQLRETRLAEVEAEMWRLGLWQYERGHDQGGHEGGLAPETNAKAEAEAEQRREQTKRERVERLRRCLRPTCMVMKPTDQSGGRSLASSSDEEVRQMVPGVFCSSADLARLDADLDVYLNGDIAAMEFGDRYVRSLLGAFARLSSRRRKQFHARVRSQFTDLLEFAMTDVERASGGSVLSGAKLSTDEVRPWGFNGEEVRCYAVRERSLFGTEWWKQRQRERRKAQAKADGVADDEYYTDEEDEEDEEDEANDGREPPEEGILEYYKRIRQEAEDEAAAMQLQEQDEGDEQEQQQQQEQEQQERASSSRQQQRGRRTRTRRAPALQQVPEFSFSAEQLIDALQDTDTQANPGAGAAGAGVGEGEGAAGAADDGMVRLGSFGEECTYRRCTCIDCAPPYTCRTHSSLVVVRGAARYDAEMAARRRQEEEEVGEIAEEEGARIDEWLSSAMGRSELKKACAAKRKVLKVMAKEAKVRAAAAEREAEQAQREAEAMKRKVQKYRRAEKRLKSASTKAKETKEAKEAKSADAAGDFSSEDADAVALAPGITSGPSSTLAPIAEEEEAEAEARAELAALSSTMNVASLAEAEVALEAAEEAFDEATDTAKEAGEKASKVTAESKAGRSALEKMVREQATAYYVMKAARGVVEKGRQLAEARGVGRPWDGAEGAKFARWRAKRQKKQEEEAAAKGTGSAGCGRARSREGRDEDDDEGDDAQAKEFYPNGYFSFEFLDRELRKHGIKKEKEEEGEADGGGAGAGGSRGRFGLPSVFKRAA